jgi:D-alanyl-lipoteichoic acid acyltransferase DltB (MBOAT superfamily)
MNDAWFAAIVMFNFWMGTTLIYILYGYPIKMWVEDNKNCLKDEGGKNDK